jgi:hypothetical protein
MHLAPHCPGAGQQASEASPRTAKSVGTPNGPCGFLSASSRRDSRSVSADRRHPLRRIGRPKPKSPSLCHPSWLVRRSKRLCGSGREERYALPGTWLKCQSSRDQGSLAGCSRWTAWQSAIPSGHSSPWSVGFEVHTVENLAAVISCARQPRWTAVAFGGTSSPKGSASGRRLQGIGEGTGEESFSVGR